MGISYKPFFRTLKEKQISQYKLLQSGVNNNTLDRLRKGLPINTETISFLCEVMHCQPQDIIEFIPNEKP